VSPRLLDNKYQVVGFFSFPFLEFKKWWCSIKYKVKRSVFYCCFSTKVTRESAHHAFSFYCESFINIFYLKIY
jgi:hypothetical protein